MLVADVPIEVFTPVDVSSASEVLACVAISINVLVDESNLSYVPVVVLYLNIPVTPVGRCAVVPFGNVNAPVLPDKISCVSVCLMLLCVMYKLFDVSAAAL